MHVTQTYLGDFGGTGLFCYYLFEDYKQGQANLTRRIKIALDDLGGDYLHDIDLFRPNERFAGNIAKEVREIRPIWERFAGEYPGFLISYKPLVQIDVNSDTIVFYSLKDTDEKGALAIIQRIRDLAREHAFKAHIEPDKSPKTWFERLWDATEIKLGGAGVKVDIKMLFRRDSRSR